MASRCAAGLALELIGDQTAAEPLGRLLAKPGMSGHVESSIEIVHQRETPGGTSAVTTRRESLRELLLARALYRCGDYQGVGKKILESYTKDLRGHLARHAKAVLQRGSRSWDTGGAQNSKPATSSPFVPQGRKR